MNIFRFTVSPTESQLRVDLFLSRATGEAREFVKQHQDTLQINGNIAKLSYRLKEGDEIVWNYPDRTLPPTKLSAENIPLDILFEDEHLLVINKPAGMVVHPAKGHWEGTLCHALLHHLGENSDFSDPLRPGIVHRLDKDTSGLMVVAKDIRTQHLLSKSFKNREILKVYTALIQGHLSAHYGKIEEPIGRSRSNRLLFAVDKVHGRESHTEYHVIEEYSRASLIKVRIHTGRTHQIRVHLQYIGHPIIGDRLYSRTYKSPPLCLAATKLGFLHPFTKERLQFSIPLPPEIEKRMESFQ